MSDQVKLISYISLKCRRGKKYRISNFEILFGAKLEVSFVSKKDVKDYRR
jgi:hypothetical protein